MPKLKNFQPTNWFLTSLLLLAFALTGCGSDDAADNGDTLNVVTTIAQVADAVSNIGGDHVTVTPLMGAGVDPHLYVASAGDVQRLQDADLIFYNGLFLEAQMEEVLEQIGEDKPAIAIAEAVDKTALLESEDYADENDPHIWFNVLLWRDAVATIADTLAEADPEHAADFAANSDAYLAALNELHSYVEAQLGGIPAQQRVLITAHDAFNYFGDAYGFEVMGLQGLSTEAEAGIGDVQELASTIVERQIPAIFVESSVPVRNIEALQAAVRDQGHEVTIGGELFSDAMGEAGTDEGTYIGMVRHNVDTIAAALGQ